MSHLTLQHIEIAIAVFQAHSSRFPDSTQDILQNIWREKQRLEEEKSKLAEAEAKVAEAEKCIEDAEKAIANMDLTDLAK